MIKDGPEQDTKTLDKGETRNPTTPCGVKDVT